jgi:hypothetical protein
MNNGGFSTAPTSRNGSEPRRSPTMRSEWRFAQPVGECEGVSRRETHIGRRGERMLHRGGITAAIGKLAERLGRWDHCLVGRVRAALRRAHTSTGERSRPAPRSVPDRRRCRSRFWVRSDRRRSVRHDTSRAGDQLLRAVAEQRATSTTYCSLTTSGASTRSRDPRRSRVPVLAREAGRAVRPET